MTDEELTEFVQNKFMLVCRECKSTNIEFKLVHMTRYERDITPGILYIQCKNCYNEVDEWL